MKRTSPAQRRKRLAALIVLSMTMTLMILLMVLDLPDSSSDGASGTMMERSASAFSWRSGATASSLDDPLNISFRDLPSALASAGTGWKLVASRTVEYDAMTACTLREWKPGEEAPSMDHTMVPRRVECLDAGPWHVFVLGEDRTSHKLSGTLEIQNGPSALEMTQVVGATGYDGALAFELAVHRPASADGFDGLHERSVDVWITNGKETCAAPAEALSVPRSTLRTGRSWDDTRVRKSVRLASFQRVRNFDPFTSESDIPGISEVDVRGNCDIGEGVYNVLIGPTERGYARTAPVRVHAPPARIETAPIVVSVPSGETAEARFNIRNFSSESTVWSAQAADLAGEEWLVGSLNQTLKGGSKARGLVSVSAHDLSPGLYTTDLIVQVNDFYGTEVRIPVEMKVLPARSSRTGAAFDTRDELPGEFSISNYPNPFTAYTNIRIETRESGQVSVTIYDMSGREVQQLVDEYLSEGTHEFRFQADNLASGSYLYRVATPSGQKSETMVLVK